jgi:hypothetical protein
MGIDPASRMRAHGTLRQIKVNACGPLERHTAGR